MGKKVINATVIILTVIMLMFCIGLIYFKTLGKNKLPTSLSATNTTTVTDPQTNEVKQFLEANYYSNKTGNGKEVVELRLNTYSGPERQAIYSHGIQLVIENGFGKLYFYNTHLNESFISCEEFAWGTPMYMNMNDELFALKMNGTRTYREVNVGKTLWFVISGLFTGYGNSYERITTEFTEKYTWLDVMQYIKTMIISSSYGTGDSLIPMLNLNTFFNVYEVNSDGQISAQPIGGNNINEFTANYFSVQCHYDNRGMVYAEQSLFNSVAGDSEFNISNIDFDVNYWQARNEYLITEKDFEVRKNNGTECYSLSNEIKNNLNLYNEIDIRVNFNVDNLENKEIGFDYLAFSGLSNQNIKLEISSTDTVNFIIKYNSFSKTNIKIEDIKLTNVNLIIEEVPA